MKTPVRLTVFSEWGRDARPQELPYSNTPSPRHFTVTPDDDADR